MNLLSTLTTILATSVFTLVLLALYVRRTLPNMLEDVAVSAGEQIVELIKGELSSPAVSKAMTVLGKKSGEVRADKALRNKAADKLLESVPSIGFILNQLDLTPIEGLQLMNDPLIGPFIKGMLAKGMGGISKALGGGLKSAESTSEQGSLFSVT